MYSALTRQSLLHRLAQMEPCRPARGQFAAPEVAIGSGPSDLLAYTHRLIAHLRGSSEMTQKEHRYLSLLAAVLDRETSSHGHLLRDAMTFCRVSSLSPVLQPTLIAAATVPHAKQLPWRVLPPGAATLSDVRSHFDSLSKERPDLDWDMERLDFAQKLKPSETWIGKDDFDGYVIFAFSWTKAALLDHPIKGNACFILRGRWRELSHLPKGELLERHPRLVTRVVHHVGWKDRIRNVMKRLKSDRRSIRRQTKKRTTRSSR